ncbi:hypothetical protein [Curtobacterium flaccumfaciens]|uniref:hypothetical protein n=1 Tax=Curtobacterium flaccumfaciens TaxID=2035 RepID=UPI002659EFA6|nr:hypothetical protein [Curtobacterium flaccumfaciens]MCS5505159.1 hypothetical protein [Curtobacterium flaccumfaciens pv. flaccumfaciens]
MKATVAVARTTVLVLRRHLVQSVGGRLAAWLLASLLGIAVVSYNFFAYEFLTRFLPADLPTSSLISGDVLVDAFTAAQVTTAGGIAVLVLIVAPGHSELRTAAQVLSARRFHARVGESLPFTLLVVLASLLLAIGPAAYLTSLVGKGPLSFAILLGVNAATAVAVVLVGELVRLLCTGARLAAATSQLGVVLAAVTLVALAVYDSTASARENRTPSTATWVDAVTGGHGVDGSAAATAFAGLSAAVLTVSVLGTRFAQPTEPISQPHRLVTLRHALPTHVGWLGRETAMALRQPLAQISGTVSLAAIVLLGIAVRGGALPLATAVVAAGVVAAAPLELAWARVARWAWMYRSTGISATHIVATQLGAGALPALLLSAVFYTAVGAPPTAAALVHHLAVLAAAAAIAYLAGVLVPADSTVPAAVVVTSTVAVTAESVLIWVGGQADGAGPWLPSLLFSGAGLLAAVAAGLRVARRLDADG